jgi:hypothetical protein
MDAVKANLRRGKLIPPGSLVGANSRLGQLNYEIKSIRAQLDEPERADRFASTERYQQWRESAARALILLLSERRQLVAWIERNRNLLTKNSDGL